MVQYDFNNALVLITGGAQGLGYSLAQVYSKQNARIALVDIQKERLTQAVKTLGNKVMPFICDVSNYQQVRDVVENIENELGTIEILVNNAGIVSTEHILDLDSLRWDKIINVNLTGAFYMLQAVARHMVKHGVKGRIINISSLSGRNGGIMVSAAYSASKAGLLGLTKAAARQLAPYGITVNAVAPGSLESEMLRSFGDEKVEILKQGMPLGRLGSFQDVAMAVLFLSSRDAEFINGVCLDVNGGQYIAP